MTRQWSAGGRRWLVPLLAALVLGGWVALTAGTMTRSTPVRGARVPGVRAVDAATTPSSDSPATRDAQNPRDGLTVDVDANGASPGRAAGRAGLAKDLDQDSDDVEGGDRRAANPAAALPARAVPGAAVGGAAAVPGAAAPAAAVAAAVPGGAAVAAAVPGGAVPGAGVSAAAAPAWTPSTALPAPSAGSRRVDVVLTPHPDDETLSLGVWTADAVLRGDRVILVSLTDGRGTGALPTLETRLGHTLTRDQIGTARILELRAAAAALGIAPSDVYLAHLDAANSTGGTRLAVAEAAAVIRALAARFPGATFATMSWTAERHPDHRAAGYALWQAQSAGIVHASVYAVSRLWWALPSPAAWVVHPTSAEARRRVVAAAVAYGVWDPRHGRYAVGWTSVHAQFQALLGDPRDRMHLWVAPRTPFAPTASFRVRVPAARPAGGPSPRHPL